jgi:ATP-dependent helicase YprA (DUF1998 family)
MKGEVLGFVANKRRTFSECSMTSSQALAARSTTTLDAVEEILGVLTARYQRDDVLTSVRLIPAREAKFRPIPGWVTSALSEAYHAKGIQELYSHQAATAELVHEGKDVVVVTPTASGKTLCYNLPVLNAVLENPDTRTLYLFPTKALAQDQLAELHDLSKRLSDCFGVFTYDGDTPSDARTAIRERGHVVLTNPDMLHTGILPHHTKWMRLFENLRYIVLLDELHTYRGVFGSHLANVLRRLRRIAKFYGSNPQFICCSATIANPGELASQLIESRAGRRSGSSCAVFVASSAPLDQFIVQHPDYFFGSSPEHAHIQPDNLEILVNHLKCAAFELPLSPDEQFGNVDLAEICERLGEAGFLHKSGGNWHWVQEAYPADTISLRSVTSDNFVIIDTTGKGNGEPEVIGEVDFSSALTTVHPKAIYIHQGQQYHVERLDFDKRKAYVKRVNVDYFTDAIRYTQVRVLEIAEEEGIPGPAARAHGDVFVRSQVVGFKKIKFFTNENVGSGKLELPENETHTTAFWVTLGHELLAQLPFTLSERQSGVFGLLYALGSMATLLLMCDRRDLGTAAGERPPSAASEIDWEKFAEPRASETTVFFEPNLYLYDAYPGGIGFSEPLYGICNVLFERTHELVSACPCENGCPSCVGPAGDKSERSKEVVLAILERLLTKGSLVAAHAEKGSERAI